VETGFVSFSSSVFDAVFHGFPSAQVEISVQVDSTETSGSLSVFTIGKSSSSVCTSFKIFSSTRTSDLSSHRISSISLFKDSNRPKSSSCVPS
jgi:hypothetical protein